NGIVRAHPRRIANLELSIDVPVHSYAPWNYRNRGCVKVQSGPEFKTGYFRMASHELLAVEECPISSPLINRGMVALWQSGRKGSVPSGIEEIEFFANADDTQLLVEVSARADSRRAALRAWAEEFRTSIPEISG